MKMGTAIAVVGVFVALAIAVVAVLRSGVPVQVVGDLSRAEAAGICRTIQRDVRPPILPDLSLQSLRSAPGLFWDGCRDGIRWF